MNRIIQNVIDKAHDPAGEAEDATTETEATTTDTSGDFIDRRFDPHWIPSPSEHRQMVLDALRAEIMRHVRFDENIEKTFWDRFKYDAVSNTIGVRPEFRDAPGAVSFHFSEDGKLLEITGPGIEDLHVIKDVEMRPEDEEPSIFEIPDPYAIPKPKL